jgi:hypothetical protein
MMPSEDPTDWIRATSAGAGVGERAEHRLRSSPYLALRVIGCANHEGSVTLRGCVPTYYLKQLAQEIVSGTEGVRDHQLDQGHGSAVQERLAMLVPSRKRDERDVIGEDSRVTFGGDSRRYGPPRRTSLTT